MWLSISSVSTQKQIKRNGELCFNQEIFKKRFPSLESPSSSGTAIYYYPKASCIVSLRRLWWDASNANMMTKPKTDSDVQQKMDACLELIEYLKENKPPSGIVLDPTHVRFIIPSQKCLGVYRFHPICLPVPLSIPTIF